MYRSCSAALGIGLLCIPALACHVHASSVPQPATDRTATSDAMAAPVLPPGGRYLSAGEQLQVQGQAMTGWIFEAPGDIREIAKWLSNQLPVLRDLLVAPGLVVLSGMDAQSHWSARLTDGGRGWVQGTLSRLPLEQSPVPMPAVPWQPEGARLQFDVRWREKRLAGAQQVWTHGATPANLRQRLRAALQRDGWRASETDAIFPGRWVKASVQLSIVVVEQPPGSAIVTVLDWRE